MMSKIVIDASATLAWLFAENGQTKRIESAMKSNELVAPWLWRLEVVNVVLIRERRKLQSVAQGTRLIELLEDLDIEFVAEPSSRTLSNLADLARPHQLTSYDAVYLDLTMKLGLPLLSRDQNLRSAATRVGVQLI